MEERDAAVRASLGEELWSKVQSARIFMVGCGGIGCELLKNLVAIGFRRLEIIDMDTIDESNLNRQFLFRKRHVGMPKSFVARDAALRLCPEAQIEAHCQNVKELQFGPAFIKRFTVVVNALDNLEARKHMNRVCLAAGVPLIESGSAGYLGQVQPIPGTGYECFECQPKAPPAQFPYCTIHSTPSKPIHCIIWAKEALFAELFGAKQPDDEEEDDATAAARQLPLPEELEREGKKESSISAARGYFHRYFNESVYRVLQLEALWEKRRKPTQLTFEEAVKLTKKENATTDEPRIREQVVWSVSECAQHFIESFEALQARKEKSGSVEWDKDDLQALTFVTAAANLRSYCYGLPLVSRFEAKEKAGNIIPAIATTNAIVAGLIVSELLQIVAGNLSELRFVFVNREPMQRGALLSMSSLEKGNAQCMVCSEGNHYVFISANLSSSTLGDFRTDVLQTKFSLVAPEIMQGDRLLYDEGDEDLEPMLQKTFEQVGVSSGSILEVNDHANNIRLLFTLTHVQNPTVTVDNVEQPAKFVVTQESSSTSANAAEEPQNKRQKSSE